MPMVALQTLQKKYANKLGSLKRQFEFTPGQEKIFHLKKYHLDNQTFFECFYLFLKFQRKKSLGNKEQEEYSKFFEKFSETLAEVRICAVIKFLLSIEMETPQKPEEVKSVISSLSSDEAILNHALQFAVIEYLTHFNQINNTDWYSIIKKLLQLGADIRFERNKDTILIPENTWLQTEKDNLNSAWRLTFFSIIAYAKVVQLAETYQAFNKNILTELEITYIIVNFSSLNNPLFYWLEKTYPAIVIKTIENNSAKMLQTYCNNRDWVSINYLRTQYERRDYLINIFSTLANTINYDVLNFLKDHYFEKLVWHFNRQLIDDPNFIQNMINNNLIEILQLVLPSPQCYLNDIFKFLPKPIAKTPSFQWVMHTHPQAIYDYFCIQDNKQIIVRNFSSSEVKNRQCQTYLSEVKARSQLAYQCNIDWFFYGIVFSIEDKAKLNSYYQRRARIILDFIYQYYPDLGKQSSVLSQGNKLTVQKHFDANVQETKPTSSNKNSPLSLLVAKLELAHQSVNKAVEIFIEIYEMTDEYIKTPNLNDSFARNVFSALAVRLTDHSPLSQFARREFDIYRICVPFLCGLNDKRKLEPLKLHQDFDLKDEQKDSAIYLSDTHSQNQINNLQPGALGSLRQQGTYAGKALSQIFGFLGNFGAKAGDDTNSAPYRWDGP